MSLGLVSLCCLTYRLRFCSVSSIATMLFFCRSLTSSAETSQTTSSDQDKGKPIVQNTKRARTLLAVPMTRKKPRARGKQARNTAEGSGQRSAAA